MKTLPLAALACPDCRQPLTHDADVLKCPRCGAGFKLAENPPCFYPPSRAAEIQTQLAIFKNRRGNSFLRALIPPNPICDPGLSARSKRVRERMAQGVILNLGAKSADWGAYVLNLDLAFPANGGVDMLCDIVALPFLDASVDGVICTYVLEHVADARACFAEIARVLKPGGCAYIAVPFIFPYHPDPLDRWRWTREGLRFELKAFEELESGCSGGPFSAAVALAPAVWASLFPGFFLFNAVRFALGWLLWPLKFLDYLSAASGHAQHAGANVYFLGVKKAH